MPPDTREGRLNDVRCADARLIAQERHQIHPPSLGGRYVSPVDRRDDVAGQRTARQRLAVLLSGPDEVGDLLRVAGDEVLVRRRKRPPALRLDLLGDVLVAEDVGRRRVRLDAVLGLMFAWTTAFDP